MPQVDMDFDGGLIPAVAQDAETDEVVMLAYVSPTALARTEETGVAHYYSRSREELWKKGEESGHLQHVREIRTDCDGDAVLYRVEQIGGACHTGYHSCFHRRIDDVTAEGNSVEASTVGRREFDPDAVYDD